MQHKKSLKHNISLSQTIVKGTGPFRMLPLFIVYIILPMMQYAEYLKEHSIERVKGRIMIDSQLYIPIASIINIIIILYVFFDYEGKEGIRFYERKLVRILLVPEVFFDLAIIPVFIYYYSLIDNTAVALYLRCIMISAFYLACSVLLTWFFNGITMAIVSCVVSTTLCVMELIYGVNISYYAVYNGNTSFIMGALPFLIISVIVLLVYDRILEDKE